MFVVILIVDLFYREYLRWMSRGNARAHKNAWIGYCRLSRTMITGYKRKKLGLPSDKAAGSDTPRATWRAVFLSEIIMPMCMAILFVVAYLFVKSFPQVTGRENASPLVRIAIVSLGPIVWNAAVLLILFFLSLFLGPMLDSVSPKFGSAIAFIAHVLALVGMVGFFEFLVCQAFFFNLRRKVAYSRPTFFSFCSGSLNSGTGLMQCWV